MQSNYSVDIRHSFSISSQKKKKKKKISYTSRSISIKYAWNRSRIKERKHSLENKGCAANFFFLFHFPVELSQNIRYLISLMRSRNTSASSCFRNVFRKWNKFGKLPRGGRETRSAERGVSRQPELTTDSVYFRRAFSCLVISKERKKEGRKKRGTQKLEALQRASRFVGEQNKYASNDVQLCHVNLEVFF